MGIGRLIVVPDYIIRYMNKIFFSLLISIFSISYCLGQEFEKVVISDQDNSSLYINDNDSTELYYLKLVPKSKPIGAVVIFPSGGETVQDLLKQIEIPQLAYNNNVLTIIPSINWGTETRNVEIGIIDEILKRL